MVFWAFRDREFQPTDLNIILMNEKSEPLRTWIIAQAIPKKWLVCDLNATDNAIVVETLELMYRYFTMRAKDGILSRTHFVRTANEPCQSKSRNCTFALR